VNQTVSFEATSKRDRAFLLATLAGLSVLAWIFMGYQAWGMKHMENVFMLMPANSYWKSGDLFIVFIMWVVMMVAMMVPSAAPIVLTFASVNRKRHEAEDPFVPTWIFLSGYLVVWTGFSFLATVGQWVLHTKALLSPMMVSTSPFLGGVLLIAAGIFQWTPFKTACLSRCRTPLSFLMTDWREGKFGAFMMGLRHGTFCTGCCWALMTLLFVTGVMNLFWIAGISVFVLLEKIAPKNFWISELSGVLFIGLGVLMMANS